MILYDDFQDKRESQNAPQGCNTGNSLIEGYQEMGESKEEQLALEVSPVIGAACKTLPSSVLRLCREYDCVPNH